MKECIEDAYIKYKSKPNTLIRECTNVAEIRYKNTETKNFDERMYQSRTN